MAATPPLQIYASPQTPPTPLHGGAYDNLEPRSLRRPTRSNHHRIAQDIQSTPDTPRAPTRATRSATSPGLNSPDSQSDLLHPRSPQPTPRGKSSRRVQIISPSSPDPFTLAPDNKTSSTSRNRAFASSTTTISEGMLPTPMKTPKKKVIPKAGLSARVLFQEQPMIGEAGLSGVRFNRKGKRYNGFSLESFSTTDETGGQIQIFTDSRDKVPEVDTSEENPFVDGLVKGEDRSRRRVVRTSKRRKISDETKRDSQVEEAIKKDEGMVYVFRGKKVYRKFDDADDEDQDEIATDDLGLLEYTPNGTELAKTIKPLTRKSIRPTRLFQTEAQKHARELEKEEEAATDIEDNNDINRSDILNTPHDDDKTQPGRSLRSTKKQVLVDAVDAVDTTPAGGQSSKSKKSSPFDSWRRVKAGSSSDAVSSKGKKRGATEAGVAEESSTGKKIRAV